MVESLTKNSQVDMDTIEALYWWGSAMTHYLKWYFAYLNIILMLFIRTTSPALAYMTYGSDDLIMDYLQALCCHACVLLGYRKSVTTLYCHLFVPICHNRVTIIFKVLRVYSQFRDDE